MEKEILKEIEKGLSKREKILLKIFAKTLIKVFHMGRIECFNSLRQEKLVSVSNKITFI